MRSIRPTTPPDQRLGNPPVPPAAGVCSSTDNPHRGDHGVTWAWSALKNSISGIRFAIDEESAFRQELTLCVVLLPCAFIIPATVVEHIMMLGTLVLALIVELLNSSIEAAVGHIPLKQRGLPKRAKDFDSATVILALLLRVGTWAAIAWPQVVSLLHQHHQRKARDNVWQRIPPWHVGIAAQARSLIIRAPIRHGDRITDLDGSMETKQRSTGPHQTRDRIPEVSLRLFSELDEPNVTTTTIIEELEINPGNLYYRFRNKNDIINSIFMQFEQEIARRLKLPDDHRATLNGTWGYLQYMSEFLWNYRFLYRNINNLLTRNRMLELNFRRIVRQKRHFAIDICHQFIGDGEVGVTAEQIDVICTDIMVITTYWLSFQFVQHPRRYNDQDAIRDHLHGANYHILSVLALYLRGRPRRAFDLLTASRSNDPPIGAPGTPNNNTPVP